MSFAAADGILTATSCGSFSESLASHPIASKKLIVTQTIADVLPSVGFFDTLEKRLSSGETMMKKPEKIHLITVGRLHQEKMFGDLIRMAAVLKEKGPPLRGVILTLVGDGPERGFLEKLAQELGVLDSVIFAGALPNEELPKYLSEADVYLSPMTGTSLREAALCGLPIVAYDIDWVHGFLKHDENALLVPRGDYQEMARQVLRLAEDSELRLRLSNNIKELALSLWSPSALKSSLEEVFG
jgi:glycosyltransferase involved in cell wall biosynthesis